MGSRVNPEVVADWEEVARILFSPLFISEGVLSQRAFLLEQTSNETYISVLRLSMECFEDDIKGIKREGNTLYGYAGIFTMIGKKRIKGGMPQTPERMLARMYLVRIAQERIVNLPE